MKKVGRKNLSTGRSGKSRKSTEDIGQKHLVITDCQVQPGQPTEHLDWLGHYIVDKKPDTVICIGDFNDLPSLCSYDEGKKTHEGKRYVQDCDAGIVAMSRLWKPLEDYNRWAKTNHCRRYEPRRLLTLGNHEERIIRAVEADAKLEGKLSIRDLGYENFGWEVHDFLEVVVVDGVAYSHYFSSGIMGKPITSARALLVKKHMSCFAGHLPGREIAYDKRGDGRAMTAIIAGSFYPYGMSYLNPQTNEHWRGIYVLHEVIDGSFDEMAVSLNFLRRKYGR